MADSLLKFLDRYLTSKAEVKSLNFSDDPCIFAEIFGYKILMMSRPDWNYLHKNLRISAHIF